MNGHARSRILDSASANGVVSVGSMYVDTVVAACFDPETGEPIFSPSDRDALMQKSAGAIDRLAEVGMRLSGMSATGTDDAKRRFPEELAPEVSV